ncbi:MAG TPA: SGNH/GDSL hydrolase family protein [Marmoricola sp.]|nr:SGNH/GDSL hydrolase family protein [Marmoricola sp.]
MTTTHPRRRAGTALAGVMIVLLALSACGRANPHPPIKDITSYVALGDSYTAVSGEGPFTDDACKRSVSDYPSLIAKRLSISHFVDASCGGATSANLKQTQTIAAGGSNPPQLDSVTKDTKLVTLGIGLNDNGISYYLLYACIPVNGKTSTTCTQYLNLPASTVDKAVASIGRQVRTNILAIRHKAPHARIVLVGYPRLVSETDACPSQVPVPAEALARIRQTLIDLNSTLHNTAKSTNVDYIDMYTASAGHDVCSTAPWVNGQLNLNGLAFQFHPYAAYHVAVADKIVALLRAK